MKVNTVKRFFELIEGFNTEEADYKDVLHPDIEQTEYPNLITASPTICDYKTLLTRIPQGKALLKEQHYDIQRVYEQEDTVITEVIWTATVGIDAGAFKAGQPLRAYFCCIFEFKEGKIYRQRNYDCFERT
ncbi:nuclear transport factor 2 family protein [Paenibacillus chartarius]|uniref:Nuclear transport factor 2 family protein n=1 Tax=Paenibacillus chartarius TaxID=747481 RepID=A0ABV6DJD1_9BACL